MIIFDVMVKIQKVITLNSNLLVFSGFRQNFWSGPRNDSFADEPNKDFLKY